MTKVKDIYAFLNGIAPFDHQESWDNSGFLVGDFDKEITCAALSLDISKKAIDEAKNMGAQLIISHHPVIFNPLKSVCKNSPVFALIESGISAVCSHTCLDFAEGGVNSVLAERIGLHNVRPLSTGEGENSLIRIGELEKPMTTEELSQRVCKCLHTSVSAAPVSNDILTVAVCGGSGGEFCRELSGKADALVTGEAKQNQFVDAYYQGVTLISAGHFATENPVMDVLKRKLEEEFAEVQFGLVDVDGPVINYTEVN